MNDHSCRGVQQTQWSGFLKLIHGGSLFVTRCAQNLPVVIQLKISIDDDMLGADRVKNLFWVSTLFSPPTMYMHELN